MLRFSRMFLHTFLKPVLCEVPTYLAINFNRSNKTEKQKEKRGMLKINYMNCKTMCEDCMCVVCNCHLGHDNDYIKGLFSKIEPTVQNMNSIAEFNKIVMNYKKMLKLENDGKI